jgi:ABC-type xylose transport system permease subunit
MFKTTKIETSYHLLQLESLLTVMMFTVPVFTVFLNSVGLSQAAVGVSQAVFMAVAMLFDVPSGCGALSQGSLRSFRPCLYRCRPGALVSANYSCLARSF